MQFPHLHEMLILVCVNWLYFPYQTGLYVPYLPFLSHLKEILSSREKSACFVNIYYKVIDPLKFPSHSVKKNRMKI